MLRTLFVCTIAFAYCVVLNQATHKSREYPDATTTQKDRSPLDNNLFSRTSGNRRWQSLANRGDYYIELSNGRWSEYQRNSFLARYTFVSAASSIDSNNNVFLSVRLQRTDNLYVELTSDGGYWSWNRNGPYKKYTSGFWSNSGKSLSVNDVDNGELPGNNKNEKKLVPKPAVGDYSTKVASVENKNVTIDDGLWWWVSSLDRRDFFIRLTDGTWAQYANNIYVGRYLFVSIRSSSSTDNDSDPIVKLRRLDGLYVELRPKGGYWSWFPNSAYNYFGPGFWASAGSTFNEGPTSSFSENDQEVVPIPAVRDRKKSKDSKKCKKVEAKP